MLRTKEMVNNIAFHIRGILHLNHLSPCLFLLLEIHRVPENRTITPAAEPGNGNPELIKDRRLMHSSLKSGHQIS